MNDTTFKEWPLALAGAVLVAAAYAINPRLGGPLLVLVVLVMLGRAYSLGLLEKKG